MHRTPHGSQKHANASFLLPSVLLTQQYLISSAGLSVSADAAGMPHPDAAGMPHPDADWTPLRRPCGPAAPAAPADPADL